MITHCWIPSTPCGKPHGALAVNIQPQDMMPDLMYLQPQPNFCLIILVILCDSMRSAFHVGRKYARMYICVYIYIYIHIHPCIYVCKYIVCIYIYMRVCVILKITSQNHVKISTCNSRPGGPLALAQSSSAVSTSNASSWRLSKAYPSAGAKL